MRKESRARIWQIVPADPAHIPAIARDMREADRREVMASHGQNPEEALRAGLDCAALAWTCRIHGVPSFMWGVSNPGQPGVTGVTGKPWLLGTDRISAVYRDFLRHSRAYVDTMQACFPRLENYVHAGNRLSIRWLQWCGFTLDRENPAQMGGEDFYFFWREQDA